MQFNVSRRNFFIALLIAGIKGQDFASLIGVSASSVNQTLNGCKSARITRELQKFINEQFGRFMEEYQLTPKQMLPVADVMRKRKAA